MDNIFTFQFSTTRFQLKEPNYKIYQLKENIVLNEIEIKIFDLLTNAVKHKNINCVLRVAGGWVRDKLIGLENHDIDITIDNMTGEEFIHQIKDYLKEQTGDQLGGFGVTKLNPEKSKHLETATIKLFDLWIDFVNLRGEVYEETTRIPIMKMGTAEEDAQRRDLTINSLFYNLMTQEIEDLTKKGLEDLKQGIVRTPLHPHQTFLDDPLRILRTFRFASRFYFKIDETIPQTIKSEEIIMALTNKVSRERIGIEVNSVLMRDSAFTGLQYYYINNIWNIIFEIPQYCPDLYNKPEQIKKTNALNFEICQLINQYLNLTDEFKITDKINLQYTLYLCGVNFHYFHQKFNKNKIAPNLIFYVIKESLKFPNKDAENTFKIIEAADSSKKLFKLDFQDKKDFVELVKWLKEIGNKWEITLFMSLMGQLQEFHEHQIQDQIINQYDNLRQYIFQENLEKISDLKTFVDGKEIMQLFGLDKPGPAIKKIMDNIYLWQVANRKMDKQNLIDEIKKDKDQFLN